MSTQIQTIQRSKTRTNTSTTDALNDNDTRKKDARKQKRGASFRLGGFSAPPVILPAIIALMCYYREIPFWDRFFSVAFPIYIYLANRFRFDNNSKQIALRKQRGEDYPGHPDFFSVNKESWFPKYMVFAASLGVILPLTVQVIGPRSIAEATAPHLFMLLCQIMMEMMGHSPEFHPMLWLMVPLGYSSYRLSSLKTWSVVAWEMFLNTQSASNGASLLTWEMFHLLLAASNTLFWTYNLFVTLTLRIQPQCMDQNNFPNNDVSWKYMLPSANRSDGLKVKN